MRGRNMPPMDMTTTTMFTFDQIRRLLPEGASQQATAIRARCLREGAHYVAGGFHMTQVREVRAGRMTTTDIADVLAADEPFDIYTWDQVFHICTAELGWHPTATSVRYHLTTRGVRSYNGYAPADNVRKALARPAGYAWRKGIPGHLKGRTFDSPLSEADAGTDDSP